MRNTGYLLVCFLLSSCLPKQDQIFVKHFLGPGLNRGEAILHEYVCNQEQVAPFKYILMQRDSMEKDVYHYLIFDQKMTFLNGATEKRETGQTRTLKRYFPEQDADPSKYHIHSIDVNHSIPDYLTLYKPMHYEMSYTSVFSDNTIYIESDFQVEGMDSISILNRSMEVLKLSAIEQIKTVATTSSGGKYLAQKTVSYFGFTKGLLGMDIEVEGIPTIKLRLKDIHKRDEYERLLKKHGKKHPNLN